MIQYIFSQVFLECEDDGDGVSDEFGDDGMEME